MKAPTRTTCLAVSSFQSLQLQGLCTCSALSAQRLNSWFPPALRVIAPSQLLREAPWRLHLKPPLELLPGAFMQLTLHCVFGVLCLFPPHLGGSVTAGTTSDLSLTASSLRHGAFPTAREGCRESQAHCGGLLVLPTALGWPQRIPSETVSGMRTLSMCL